MGEMSKNRKWHFPLVMPMYDSNSNNWKKCEGAERDIVQCIGYVIQLEHEHIAW